MFEPMQSAISSKLSLFDIISMVVPGGILLGVLLLLCSSSSESVELLKKIPEWGQLSLFIIASYVLGLINCEITELLWRCFRNNPEDIWYAFMTIDKKRLPYKRYYSPIIFSFYIFIFLLLVIDLSEYHYLILISIIIIFYFLRSIFPGIKYDVNDYVRQYYHQYYFVEKYRPWNAVKIIEAQVAFLKSICFPLCIASAYLVKTAKYCGMKGWIIAITILSLLAIISVAVCRQNTIYRIIIEDYKHLYKRISKDEINN